MRRNELLKEIKDQFIQKSIDESDAVWLMCEVLNCNRNELKATDVSNKHEKKIRFLTQKRLKNIPLAYILKKREFYGLNFYVNKNVLIPRFETEGLVEITGQKLQGIQSQGKLKGLDVGTGSGAIAITLAREFGFNMTATDISAKALNVAKKNAKQISVKINFKKGNLLEPVIKTAPKFRHKNRFHASKFDFIVSNPPYILSDEMSALNSQVKNNEPSIALDGGADGLIYYKRIIQDAPQILNPKGWLFFEIHNDCAEIIKNLMKNNFELIEVKKDMQGLNRYIYGQLKSKNSKEKIYDR